MQNKPDLKLSKEMETLERLKYSGLVSDKEYMHAKGILQKQKGEA